MTDKNDNETADCLDAPVCLCCGQRHQAPVCPTGKVLCCICFECFEQDQLNVTQDGQKENLCKQCAAIANVAGVVAEHFSLYVEDVFRKSRKPLYVIPRNMTILVLTVRHGFSQPDLAKRLGYKHSSSIHYAVKSITALIESDPVLLTSLKSVLTELKRQKKSNPTQS